MEPTDQSGRTFVRSAEGDPSEWQYHHSWQADEELVVTVAESLTEHADAEELTPPVFHTVDLTTVERLLARATDTRVSFWYRDYGVTIDSGGGIRIRRFA